MKQCSSRGSSESPRPEPLSQDGCSHLSSLNCIGAQGSGINGGFLEFVKLEGCGLNGNSELGAHGDFCFQPLGHSRRVSVSGCSMPPSPLAVSALHRVEPGKEPQVRWKAAGSSVIKTPDTARSEGHRAITPALQYPNTAVCGSLA